MLCKNIVNSCFKTVTKVVTVNRFNMFYLKNMSQRFQVACFSAIDSNPSMIGLVEKGDFSSLLKKGHELLESGQQQEAIMWLEIAAEHNDTEAAYLIGHHLTTAAHISSGKAGTAAEVLLEINAVKKAAKKAKKERIMSKSIVQNGIEHSPSLLIEGNSKETGIYWLRKAAAAGHGDAMCLIGNLLMQSNEPDRCREAIEWYERAAQLKNPHPDALYNLGNLYFEGNDNASVRVNFSKSLDYFNRAAQVGDSSALYWLGHCYASGEGGVSHINPKLSVKYLRQAAEKGHPKAHFHLATIFRFGLSASDCSCGTSSHTSSGDDVEADQHIFRYHLDLAVRSDDGADPDALFCLADMNMHGLDGIIKDEREAVRLYAEASAAGNAAASLCLGALHYNGSAGLVKSAERAFECYNIAAEQGSLEAWRNLASMYFLGDGVPKSEDTAREIMRVIFGSGSNSRSQDPL